MKQRNTAGQQSVRMQQHVLGSDVAACRVKLCRGRLDTPMRRRVSVAFKGERGCIFDQCTIAADVRVGAAERGPDIVETAVSCIRAVCITRTLRQCPDDRHWPRQTCGRRSR